MTGTRDPQQDGSIQAMLRDSGLEAATELRSTLERMQAWSRSRHRRPAPTSRRCSPPARPAQPGQPRRRRSHGTSATSRAGEPLPARVASLAERRGRKRRMAIVGGAVVGAMSLGAGAVAASSEDFRQNVGQTFGVILPARGARYAGPEHVQPSPSSASRPFPRQHVRPVPARPGLHLRTGNAKQLKHPGLPGDRTHAARRRPRRYPADTRQEA